MKQETNYPHSAGSLIGEVKYFILDALFPVYCLSCQKEKGAWICESCLLRIEPITVQVCPSCESNVADGGRLCSACLGSRKSFLDSLVLAVPYDNLTVKNLVHNLKYRFIPSTARPLGRLIIRSLLATSARLPDCLVPVPLHRRRLRWRGFNQSELIAETISGELTPHLKIEILDILERKKHNRAQMKIKNYQERKKNVKGIFGLRSGINIEKVRGKTVLLVDDIATTGSTLEECAGVLKSAGAKKVFAAVVARQTLKK